MALFLSLKHRSFALLWSGQTISRLGDSLYQVALAWWVLEKTGSAAAMGTVLICSFSPMLLFLLLGGVAVDRFPRIRVMLASDLLRGAVTSAVALLAFSQMLEIWHIYVASVLFGFVRAFFQPAYSAIVPEIMPHEVRPSANSLTSLSQEITASSGRRSARRSWAWAARRRRSGSTRCRSSARRCACCRCRRRPPPLT